MPKAKSLIDELKKARPPRPGQTAWYESLRESDPERMEEIDNAIDAWNAEDAELRAALPSISALAKELLPHAEIKQPSTIISYIRQRANEHKR